MSVASFLAAEYDAIAVEVKKKQLDLKKALEEARAALKEFTETCLQQQLDSAASLATFSSFPNAECIIQPCIISIDSKSDRIAGIAFGCISRLISQNAYPPLLISNLLVHLSKAAKEASITTDNALKLVQIAMGITLNYPGVTGTGMKECFSICQTFLPGERFVGGGSGNRNDVSSAASVTMRQLAMAVVFKLRGLPPGDPMASCLEDVLAILTDLGSFCLDLERETPFFLSQLPEIVALDLIETILAEHSSLLLPHLQLKEAIEEKICGPLLRQLTTSLPSNVSYSVYLRMTRLVRIILVEYSDHFPVVAETALALIVKDLREKQISNWQHVLAAEVLRAVILETRPATLIALNEGSAMSDCLAALVERDSTITSTGVSLQTIHLDVIFGAIPRTSLSARVSRFLDRLERTTPFTSSADYTTQLHFEVISHFLVRLCFSENILVKGESTPDLNITISTLIAFNQYEPGASFLPDVVVGFLNKNSLLICSWFSRLLTKESLEEHSLQNIHGLLYYVMVCSVVYKIDLLFSELFATVEKIAVSSPSFLVTRHLLVQFSVLYNSKTNLFRWNTVVKIALEHQKETEAIWHISHSCSLPTLGALLDATCLVADQIVGSPNVPLSETAISCRWLLERTVTCFCDGLLPNLLLAVEENDLSVQIFKQLLMNLSRCACEWKELQQIAMQSFASIVNFFLQQVQQKKKAILACLQEALPNALLCIFKSSISLESQASDLFIAAYTVLFDVIQYFGSIKESLQCAWSTVFACIDQFNVQSFSSTSLQQRVLKSAFQCAQLIVSDMMSSIDGDLVEKVLYSLCKFVVQSLDLNVSLTAIEHIWKAGDFFATSHRDVHWFNSLKLLSEICSDNRSDVRNASIQTLFRATSQKGPTVTTIEWDQLFRELLFPTFDQTLLIEEKNARMESVSHGIHGLAHCWYSGLESIAKRSTVEIFSLLWTETWKRFLPIANDCFELDRISSCSTRSTKLVLTAAAKSSVRNDHFDNWYVSFEYWIRNGDLLLQGKASQSTLITHVQSFPLLYSLLKASSCNTRDFLRSSIQSLNSFLSKTVFPESEACNQLQLQVLGQITTTIDSSFLPHSVDIIAVALSELCQLPMSGLRNCRAPLSLAILHDHLPTKISLSVLQNDTIVLVLKQLLDLFTFAVPTLLPTLVTVLTGASSRLINEAHESSIELPESILEIVCTCQCTLLKSIGNDIFAPIHECLVQRAAIPMLDGMLFGKLPLKWSLVIVECIVLQSSILLVRLSPLRETAFTLLDGLFTLATTSHQNLYANEVQKLLFTRCLQPFQNYTMHLSNCGSLPMPDVCYREIVFILQGMKDHSISFSFLYDELRKIIQLEKWQSDSLDVVTKAFNSVLVGQV